MVWLNEIPIDIAISLVFYFIAFISIKPFFPPLCLNCKWQENWIFLMQSNFTDILILKFYFASIELFMYFFFIFLRNGKKFELVKLLWNISEIDFIAIADMAWAWFFGFQLCPKHFIHVTMKKSIDFSCWYFGVSACFAENQLTAKHLA